MRVAIIGYGAIGHVVERALVGRAELLIIDRTRAPLDGGNPLTLTLMRRNPS